MKNLAIIPARSGSKGLRDKNILPLNGKPLLAYSIEAAFSSGCFETVHVSTDSEKYAGIARQYGADVPFLRSAKTSGDDASSWAVVLEVLESYGRLGQSFDTVTLLQPTSPLRMPDDIRRAYRLMEEKGAETVVSVCEVEHSPLWCNTLPEDHCMDGFLGSDTDKPRQALETYYRINGALYLLRVPGFQKRRRLVYGPECYAHIMPQNRSVDIDTSVDFLMVEQLLRWDQYMRKENIRAGFRSSYKDNNMKNAPPPRTSDNKYLSVLTSRSNPSSPNIPLENTCLSMSENAWRTFQVKGAPAC